jgi:hypothetical protein
MNKKVVDIADALGECLEEIETGRLTIEECIDRYPNYAAELQELLLTRQKLQDTPAIQPAAAFQQRARSQLLSQLSTPASKYPLFISALFNYWMRLSALRHRRRFGMVWLLFFVLAASVIAGGGTAIAADAAVPGDPLYSLDRSLEKVRTELTSNPEALLKLQLANAQERLNEAKKLANQRGDGEFRQALDGYGDTMLATASTFGLVEGAEQANLDSIFERSLMEHDPLLVGLLSDDDPDGDETDPDDTDGDNQNEGEPDPDDSDGDTPQDKGDYCPPDESNPHPVAVKLVETYTDTITVTVPIVMDWFCGNDVDPKGLGMGQIMLALRTEKLLSDGGDESTGDYTYQVLLQMRAEGESWGHIWQDLGIIGNGKPEDAGKPDDTGKPENAGKSEDKSTGPPDHSNKPDEPPGKSNDKSNGPPDKSESNGNNGNGNGNGKKNK